MTSMNKFFKDRPEAVQYALDMLTGSRFDLPLTITMRRVKYGGFSVSTVTGTSSDATQTPIFSKEQACI